MNHVNKGNVKKKLAWLIVAFSLILTLFKTVAAGKPSFLYVSLTTDTLPEQPVKPIRSDSSKTRMATPDSMGVLRMPADTLERPVVDTFSYTASKDSLDAPISYHAEDSMVLDVPGKKILLYGKVSDVKYVDNELTAPVIEFDQRSNLVKAALKKDSSGKVVAFPTYIQNDFKSISDSITFSLKSGKGYTTGTYTQQGEMFVYGEKIKKVDTSTFYAYRGRFTTCNLDTPHFAFVSKKIKFINKKMAFTGPVHPEIEGVPLPIVLPFGIYPLKQGRHSGLIAPSWTANEQFGLALEGLGYYKVISDNWDVVLRGTLYSYGGWTFNVSPRYYKRYHYQGNFSVDLQHFKYGLKGDKDYRVNNSFNVRWVHGVDSKARPGVSFSANVNFGGSQFNSQVPNNPQVNISNQMSSSISYAKIWKNKPYNLAISANHNQNTVNKQINVNLPDVSFNVNTQYPFRRKEVIGKYKWYENIGIALNTNARSFTTFSDTSAVGEQIMKNFQWGANHSVPLTMSLPPMGVLQVSPTVSYAERWYQKRVEQVWDPVARKLDTIEKRGFYSARDMSFSLGIGTRIFGMFGFKKNSPVQAIRHEIRPQIGISYKPNMNKGNYYTTVIDTFGRTARYSYYAGSVFGAFSEQRFAGLNFSLDNVIQMKVRNRKGEGADSGVVPTRKISLLDGFLFTGNYNFLLDSFRLSPISVAARSTLFDKVGITASAILDPYQTDPLTGRRINKLVWQNKPLSLGKMTSLGLSMQTQFQGGDKSKQKGSLEKSMINNLNATSPTGMPLDEFQAEAAYMSQNPNDFVDFSIPWSVNLTYSFNLSKVRSTLYPGSYDKTVSQNASFTGSVNLTPKWKVSLNGYYDITAKQLTQLSMGLSRDLHCWQMSVSISPVNKIRFFTLNISPKSPMLRDIRVNRSRYFYEL
jgi:hypothetical protein